MKSLKNKTVLITGSSIGIGREVAYKFAEEGSRVVITYYNDKKEALEVSNECKRRGAASILVARLNIMDDSSIRGAVREVIDKFGEISVLVNNAGVVVWKSLWEQSYENIEQQIRVNLEGPMKMTKECLPYIKDTIINVASGAGMTGYERLTSYCASKFGIRGFTQALAEEVPEINVFSVNPGMTATRMTNYRGQPAEKVAEVILNVAKDEYGVKSGTDINVWEISAVKAHS